MKKIINFIIAVLVIFLLIIAIVYIINNQNLEENNLTEENTKINIVTSFLPLTIFTENVVGETANVSGLLPPGTGPHEYSLSPSDIQKLADADVFIVNGVGLEDWLDDAITSANNPDLEIIVASEGIELISEETSSDENNYVSNPHVWVSPIQAIKQVQNIIDGLATTDEKNKDIYNQNGENYIKQLQTLSTEISSKTSEAASNKIVTFHSAFAYFAHDYNLNQVAVIEEFPGKEPSAKYIADVEKQISELGIKAIFSEPQFSARLVEAIATDLNLEVSTLDPVATGEVTPDYYEKVMRANLDNLITALNK
ncbi:MAG: zinc ABC transporter substrate-binding protein [bacterium]